ncbi:hypothetical protein QFC21_006266 [Naganishia friedmannii]|uniref:Uncharacterized protein n=1 Tax=Naganishia friedmannii TaxID=89922 RepID=A0ACC2V3H4_9TREE|nr:hypothetical protein QFC21_006266 [Naganishia friedmannii]
MESAISSLVESITASGPTASSLADTVTATTTEWLSSTLTSTSSSAFPSITDIDVGLGAGGGVAISEGNPVVNFLLGIMIVLGASVMNAFGLNLTKLDHMRAQALPKHSRPADWQRPLWLLGMLAYIYASPSRSFLIGHKHNLSFPFFFPPFTVGSTLSLKYLRSDWVAPLGSTSLVFNFLFAKLLVGVEVTQSDIRGTSLIVLGVLCILVFSSINHGLDGVITVERLSQMWSRGNWLAWFFFITFSTIFVYETTHLLALLLKSRESLSPGPTSLEEDDLPTGGGRRKPPPTYAKNPLFKTLRAVLGAVKTLRGKLLLHLERALERTDDTRVRYMAGIGWAVVGGSLAGGCLVFTKAVRTTEINAFLLFEFDRVKIMSLPGKPFAHFASIITVLFVALTAVLQIICLNKGLKTADSTLVVPLFYAGYTVLGFVNSLIFMNETTQYETWVLLSLKKTEPDPAGGHTVSVTNPSTSMRLNPLMHQQGRTSARPPLTTAASGSNTRARANSRLSPRQTEPDSTIAADSSVEQVVWEVGSVSDDSDDDAEKPGAGPRGVGGVAKDGYGERGGLLFDREEEDEEGAATGKVADVGATNKEDDYRAVDALSHSGGSKRRSGEDEEDPFGDFESAKR